MRLSKPTFSSWVRYDKYYPSVDSTRLLTFAQSHNGVLPHGHLDINGRVCVSTTYGAISLVGTDLFKLCLRYWTNLWLPSNA